MSYAKLDQHLKKLEVLSHAQSMLGVDEAVMMPEGGGEKRAEAMAGLATIYHEMASAPQVGDWLAAAAAEDLMPEQRIAIREQTRSYINLTCLSSAFVGKQTEARIRSEQLWRQLRPTGDWAGFLPALSNVIAFAREEAAMRADVLKLAPYDALIEQFDPGSRVSQITPVFDELKTFLKGFIPKALDAQAARHAKHPPKAFTARFAIDRQKALGEVMMKAVGFDFYHGRLDVSHHPFCGGVPTDVRMTTRYDESDFLFALMGVLHETGHGLYEQGLPKAWSHWSVGQARGMAVHESQSLFVEKQIGRNPAFWHWALPVVKEKLGAETLTGWSLADMMQHVHRVKPGFIRVDADEVTYPMHVILRYELEQDLIAGRMEARDIPEAWDAKMTAYLGLSTKDNMKDGPMQDVHWPSGAFGYFPSYTLGALLAAQQAATIHKLHPHADEALKKGDVTVLNDWRRTNIWSKASTLTTPDLIVAATGEPLSARHFIAHVQQRYG
ncbi:carboxypeptidase M32 [Aestuariivirga sp.]|uniref:carboxypeptidase M32 n=1 Tax=Aestuariivirga sp. TaxID=2650926 RepID=UPI0039E70DBA